MVLRTRSSRALSRTAASVWGGPEYGTRAPSPSEWTGTPEGQVLVLLKPGSSSSKCIPKPPVRASVRSRSLATSITGGRCVHRESGSARAAAAAQGTQHESESVPFFPPSR